MQQGHFVVQVYSGHLVVLIVSEVANVHVEVAGL